MIAIQREAAGREWAYQLREWAAELGMRGDAARERELVRLAEQTEKEISELHRDRVHDTLVPEAGPQHMGDQWCGHWHRTFRAAFACVGITVPTEERS